MVQTFSVSAKDLPRLKHELADVIRAFADGAERSDGDTVAEIAIGFTHNGSTQSR